MLGGGLCGIDLDWKSSPARPFADVPPEAQKIIDRFRSYTEWSPSGKGCHILFHAHLPENCQGRKRRLSPTVSLEIYGDGRYFTVTGGRWHELEVTDQQAALDALLRELDLLPQDTTPPGGPGPQLNFPPGATPKAAHALSEHDAALLERMFASRSGAHIERLWNGDWSAYASHSEADLALIAHLLWWTNGDVARTDQLFRQSGLFRPKWDERHYADGRTYGQGTLQKALEGFTTGRQDDHLMNGDASGTSATPAAPAALASDRVRDELPHLTDLGNAQRFIARYGHVVRYCYPWGRWLVWDGRRWAIDTAGIVEQWAKATVRALYAEAADLPDPDQRKALLKHAMRSEAAERIRCCLFLARSDVPVQPRELDTNPWLLNVRNGTIDLRTGTLLPHRPEDMITKLIPIAYDPTAPCPRWLRFLDEITNNNTTLVRFLQRAVGMSLTGIVSDHVLFMPYGTGRNGKSTFLMTLLHLFGEYGAKAAPELLLAKSSDRHPTELADLFGKRFVVAIETAEHRRLAEVMVKELTGGDMVKARRMREDFWEFWPTHHLWLATNHKPVVRGTDIGIWSRIKLIPFTVCFEGREEKDLRERLCAELPGILRWAVEGCLEWQRVGLGVPDEVRSATEEYRAEQDVLAAFFQDRCVLGPQMRVAARALYHAYLAWCEENGEKAESQTAFGIRLRERGFVQHKGTGGTRQWIGIGLRETTEHTHAPMVDNSSG
ncbi:MAG: hypothetical protein C4346_17575, partial [Chloroflexota bacterium]